MCVVFLLLAIQNIQNRLLERNLVECIDAKNTYLFTHRTVSQGLPHFLGYGDFS